MSQQPPPPPFQAALLAGALAGTTVDLSLFPLDTLKTRLQSADGFFAAGGFRGIYRGVGSAVVGSAPGAAFFFCTYEATKSALARSRLLRGPDHDAAQSPRKKPLESGELALEHMLAASAGEIAACAIRVPTEVVKQRAQAGLHGGSSLSALKHILSHHDPSSHGGGLRGSVKGAAAVWRELYRGWGITVMREVPFTILQFPLWEALKAWGRERKARTGRGLFGDANAASPSPLSPPSSRPSSHPQPALAEVSAPESALYGSLAGAVAAGVTTPLDVLKTRVMLSAQRESAWSVVKAILRENGVRAFFAGIGPRVAWISVGGAIFLGSYQWAVNALTRIEGRRETL
ncbi:hypothetical protein VTJ83DRAFT_6434 [Remersonia thermophila]|uniref:Uncharacterized protein n=1 Tax=Remersonia thermophila TaxID=72144 RepID=A0ABR4D6Y7_9PEZI